MSPGLLPNSCKQWKGTLYLSERKTEESTKREGIEVMRNWRENNGL